MDDIGLEFHELFVIILVVKYTKGERGSIWLTSLLAFIYEEMDDYNVCSLTSNEPYFGYFHDKGRFTTISTYWFNGRAKMCNEYANSSLTRIK